jgi:hypothetical protein
MVGEVLDGRLRADLAGGLATGPSAGLVGWPLGPEDGAHFTAPE